MGCGAKREEDFVNNSTRRKINGGREEGKGTIIFFDLSESGCLCYIINRCLYTNCLNSSRFLLIFISTAIMQIQL